MGKCRPQFRPINHGVIKLKQAVKFRDRKQNGGHKGPRREENGELVLHGHGISFGEDGNTVEMDGSDGCMTLWMYLMPLNCTLNQNDQLYVLHFFHNEKKKLSHTSWLYLPTTWLSFSTSMYRRAGPEFAADFPVLQDGETAPGPGSSHKERQLHLTNDASWYDQQGTPRTSDSSFFTQIPLEESSPGLWDPVFCFF